MADVLQLIPEPDAERDEAIFRDWRRGKKTVPQLAREHNLPQSQINVIIDRQLPALTPASQVRELRHLLHDLEELRQAYQDIALSQVNPDAANVSIRTAHEIGILRQFLGASSHRDPVELQRGADPQREKSTAALERGLALLCGKPLPPEADKDDQREPQS